MKIKQENITALIPLENNIRKHSPKQIEELVKSIQQFGQIRPVVVDEHNVILAGHGLVQAFKAMGNETIGVYVASGLTKAEKNKLVLADNKIYEMGVNDYDAMNAIFSELKLDNALMDIPGFDDVVLENLFGDEDHMDDLIEDYGKLNEKTVEKLQEKAVEVQNQAEKPEKKELLLNNDVVKVEEKPNERPKPYVECPHCGEKIWL